MADELVFEQGERLEDLGEGGLKFIQNKELYTFTSDSVHLVNFMHVKHSDSCCEIGTGSGIISVLLMSRQSPNHIDAIEIQNKAYSLAKKNFTLCDFLEKITPVLSDVKEYVKSAKEYDVVFSNPPYKKIGSSFFNQNDSRAVSRHEIHLTIAQLCTCANKLLRFGGAFYVVCDANRTAELVCELCKNKLEPKEMQFTFASQNKNAQLVLVRAIKGGKSDVKITPPLFVN